MKNFLLVTLIALLFVQFGCTKIEKKQAIANKQETVNKQKLSTFSKFPVLEYHLIGQTEARWTRTPDNFRRDLEWLYKNNYYPMNLRDILSSFEGLPAGKTPVILTFDDSSSSQFRYLPNGEIDPNCAVGIIKAFHEKHPQDWPMRATFFVLVQTNGKDRNIFGQPEHPEYKSKKLQQLTAFGMEVGSHMYSHDRLSDITPEQARYSLARSCNELGKLSSQEIVSLATPMGLYPKDESVFSGNYQKLKYNIKLVVEVSGGLQTIPTSPTFNPRHIKRIQTIDSEWFKFFNRRE